MASAASVLQVQLVFWVHALETGAISDDETLHHGVIAPTQRRYLKGYILLLVAIPARRIDAVGRIAAAAALPVTPPGKGSRRPAPPPTLRCTARKERHSGRRQAASFVTRDRCGSTLIRARRLLPRPS